ncbi:MAG TPA: hypothetical protein VGH87_15780 [Polyangiaceae bacterium]
MKRALSALLVLLALGAATASKAAPRFGSVTPRGGGNCGNGKCEPPEDCNSCPQDCGTCCGNYKCEPPEDCRSCPQDCGPCH